MIPSLDRSFGIVIAYLVPGFVCLGVVSPYSPTIANWLAVAPAGDPTLGSFLYVVLGSLTAGLIVSAFRWAVIDTLHHHTGIPVPLLDFSKLQDNLGAFELAVEHNYRHYQFYAGMTLSVAFYSVSDQYSHGWWSVARLAAGTGLVLILLLTSRECLKRYYHRTQQFLGRSA